MVQASNNTDVAASRTVPGGQRTASQAAQASPTYRVSGYTVYPSGFDRISVPERDRWLLSVSDTGDGWAVRRRTMCLTYRRTWEFEPLPRARSHDFLQRCRFSEQSALNRAREVIDSMVVEGLTYDDFVEKVHHDSVEKARAVLEQESRAVQAVPHRDVRAMLMNYRWKRLQRQSLG